MHDQVDCVVVGAGVVGLAIARAIAMAGRDVIVFERRDSIGSETSSRNSEVIHAGIYYPEGSLKARLCVEGRELLYDFCQSHGVTAKKTTKLIFASDDDETEQLQHLQKHAQNNGVNLDWLDRAQVTRLEPQLECTAALLSPETGIVDSHGLMLALQGDAESHGTVVAFNSPVIRGLFNSDAITLKIGGAEPMSLSASLVINCAGLGAQSVSCSIDGLNTKTVPPQHSAKGTYFYYSGKAPFSRLIYPLPGAASLGVHYTLDLSGQGRFGPDIEWVDTLSYDVDPSRAASFYKAIRRYWPALPDDSLRPGYAGIRPKIQAQGEVAHDFVIQTPQETGVPGYCALYGIESPGLTSSLAIADYVAERVL